MELQRVYERMAFEAGRGEYACPIQWAGDFLAGRASHGQIPSSYPRQTVTAWTSAGSSLPRSHKRCGGDCRFWTIAGAGVSWPERRLVAPEARGSSPVRFPRDPQSLCSVGVAGCIPWAKAPATQGGIVSAALDGVRAAKSIIAQFAPLERQDLAWAPLGIFRPARSDGHVSSWSCQFFVQQTHEVLTAYASSGDWHERRNLRTTIRRLKSRGKPCECGETEPVRRSRRRPPAGQRHGDCNVWLGSVPSAQMSPPW